MRQHSTYFVVNEGLGPECLSQHLGMWMNIYLYMVHQKETPEKTCTVHSSMNHSIGEIYKKKKENHRKRAFVKF